jgi:hypothetical protein
MLHSNVNFHIKNALPPQRENECYTWGPVSMCRKEQTAALENGTAVMKDSIVRDV